MSTCVRKCTFARACNVGANSLNVVSRTFPHFSLSMSMEIALINYSYSVTIIVIKYIIMKSYIALLTYIDVCSNFGK